MGGAACRQRWYCTRRRLGEWITYEFRKAHPVLRWLPTKLAEWIGANLSEAMLIPDKKEDKWTAAELNDIILHNIVRSPYGHLQTFGGIKWECYLFNGRPKARCYSFDIDGHRFRDKNPQVSIFISYTISHTTSYMISYTI